MKIKIIFTKQILLAAVITICSQQNIFSQNRNGSPADKPGMFVGLSLGPSQTQITNEGTFSGSNVLSNKMNTFFGSAEIGYFFSDYIGLSSGVSYSSYKTQLNLGAYQNNFNTIDSENETYERRVSGTDIKEVQNIGFVSVPVCLNIRIPFSKTFGFCLQSGINLSVPISKKYASSGTFTYKGYYPAYNTLLENLPAYGFPSNHSTVANGELELKPFDVSAIASAGFDFFVQEKIQIAIAACYNRSFSNISAYTSPDTFRLSSDVDQINSLMGGSSKVTFQSLGIKLSFRYFLK